MNRRIVLVGPPGVGKSTIIEEAISRGIKAIDMEDFGPKKEDRVEKLVELLGNLPDEVVLFGGADIGGEFPEDFKKVLLLPKKEVYFRRFKERDSANPEKAEQSQKGEEIYDWFVKVKNSRERHYNLVIENEGSPKETLDSILNALLSADEKPRT